MRLATIFLLSTCMANAALAQPMLPQGSAGSATTTKADNAPLTNAEGKLILGMEGRGNYGKINPLKATPAATPKNPGATLPVPVRPIPNGKMPVATPAPVVQPPRQKPADRLSSDADLPSDVAAPERTRKENTPITPIVAPTTNKNTGGVNTASPATNATY